MQRAAGDSSGGPAGHFRQRGFRQGRDPAAGSDELRLSFSSAPDNVEEVELGLQSYDKGVFEKLPAVRFRDEDLDIPTYQRRNIRIDKGS